jgi:hypothetical protein
VTFRINQGRLRILRQEISGVKTGLGNLTGQIETLQLSINGKLDNFKTDVNGRLNAMAIQLNAVYWAVIIGGSSVSSPH